jgi:hypothetical protein
MNPDDLVRLLHNIDLPFGKAPPSEFRIFAAGKIETTKGSFLFDAKAADLVTASAQEWGNEFPVDYDHAMARGGLFVVDPAASGRAAGWFKPEIRNGELWATSVSHGRPPRRRCSPIVSTDTPRQPSAPRKRAGAFPN